MRILFMGTPDFAVPSLDALVEAGYRPAAVVTGPDRPRGRGRHVSPTPVKEAALRHGIRTILQPESVKDADFVRDVRALDADLIIVVAFRILPPAVFSAARHGSFNLHGSLLPRYRGAAPIHRAVMAGDTETGVTTFFLKEKVDTGDMILQKRMPIGPDDTTGDVHDRMCVLGAEAVVETVRLIESGQVHEEAQDESLASPAPKVFREQASIPWEEDARVVHDFIRGLSPVPCAWTHWEDQDLKIYRSARSDTPVPPGSSPGEVLVTQAGLDVVCGNGCIRIVELQPEGRRRMSAEDFVRGYHLDDATVFGS